MFTLSGFREQHFLDTICPEMPKTLSDGALEALMHEYFFASLASMGNVASCTYLLLFKRVRIGIWLCCFLIPCYFLGRLWCPYIVFSFR